MSTSGRILVVDDERRLAEAISETLQRHGHLCQVHESADAALAAWDDFAPDVLVTDLKMPGTMDGLGLLREVRRRAPEIPVLVITAHGDIPSAVAMMREGAFHYLATS